MKNYLLLIVLLLSGCATTGMKMNHLKEGMTRQEVEAYLGKPNGFKKTGDQVQCIYINKLVSGWAHDRADYVMTYEGGKLVGWDSRDIRSKNSPVVGVWHIN